MKKIISMVLAACMLLGCAGSLAENTKHERVYVVTDAEGAVRSITDNIRLENEEELDELVDATMLTDLINVGGKETFTLDGETLTWQAGGKDINYQGTSDKTPALLPVVTLTLDGETISAADLKEKSGEATLTVTYQKTEEIPTLAVSAILLPEEGVTGLKLENAAVLKEMGRQVLVGWAVPGASEELEMPSSFSVTFQADHADISWMMTFTSSDPVKAVTDEIENRVELDAHLELDEAKALLTAMKNGETLPETTGKTKDLGGKVNELNDGLKELNDGAAELADGAKELSDGASDLNDGAKELSDGASDLNDGAKTLADGASSLNDGAAQVKDGAAQLAAGAKTLAAGLDTANSGAASLEDGLNTLIENNDTLNQGAQAIFAAILSTANQQIASSGLDAAGITLPELTAENYTAALDAVLAQLDPETLKAAASAQVEAAVRPQVEANKAQVQAAVEAAVQAKVQEAVEEAVRVQVLEAVLQAAGQSLTAEQYTAAVQTGQVSEEQTAQIDAAMKQQMAADEVQAQIKAAVEQQMATDEVQAQIEAAVQDQMDELVQQNVENYLATDETIAAQLASAQAGYETLSSLKDQLDQMSTFVTGVQAYTSGAKQAADGAAAVHTGLTKLNEGGATLNEGAATLAEGTSSLADGAAELSEGAATLSDGAAKLYDGTVELKDGAGKLYDGSVELSDGAKTLQETGTQKLMDTLMDAEKEAAEKLLPYVEDDLTKALRIYEETRDNAKNSGYDLRPEGMKTVTVYIIRTDLQ